MQSNSSVTLVLCTALSFIPSLAAAESPPPLIDPNNLPSGVTAPKALSCADPIGYPPVAVRLNHTGSVSAIVTISPSGSVTNIEIVSSSGYANLDAMGMYAMTRCGFQPATKGGTPIASQIQQKEDFQLRGSPNSDPTAKQ